MFGVVISRPFLPGETGVEEGNICFVGINFLPPDFAVVALGVGFCE